MERRVGVEIMTNITIGGEEGDNVRTETCILLCVGVQMLVSGSKTLRSYEVRGYSYTEGDDNRVIWGRGVPHSNTMEVGDARGRNSGTDVVWACTHCGCASSSRVGGRGGREKQ